MATVKDFNQLYQYKENVSEVLMSNIKKFLYESKDKLASIDDDQLQKLQKELLRRANSNLKYDELVKKIYELREEKQRAIMDIAERHDLKARIAEIEKFLNEFEFRIKEYDE